MEILTGAVSSLNKLLVDEHLVSEGNLQTYFMNWLRAEIARAKNVNRVGRDG